MKTSLGIPEKWPSPGVVWELCGIGSGLTGLLMVLYGDDVAVIQGAIFCAVGVVQVIVGLLLDRAFNGRG